MPKEKSVEEIAKNFVYLALDQKIFIDDDPLGPLVLETLVDTLQAAGFEVGTVVLGQLKGQYQDQGGPTGETYLINSLSPCKVISPDGKDHYFATGWLDCAFRRVIYGIERNQEFQDDMPKIIVKEIERSRPLEPILLTPQGDYLEEYPPRAKGMGGLEYFVNHSRDDRELTNCVGTHQGCSWMDRMGSSRTHDVIVCQKCHLRIPFPNSVRTYGDLRRALAEVKTMAPA
jgi:hypothetical protein